jgi:hypothetical protein
MYHARTLAMDRGVIDVSDHLWPLVHAVVSHDYDGLATTVEFNWFRSLCEMDPPPRGLCVKPDVAVMPPGCTRHWDNDLNAFVFADVDVLFTQLHEAMSNDPHARQTILFETLTRCLIRIRNVLDVMDLADDLQSGI